MKKKYLYIIGVIVLIGIITSIIVIRNNDLKSDANRFASEYATVSKDNVFVYRDFNEIVQILNNGTGIVYLGFPECPWCKAYVSYINKMAQANKIEKIYYYNILNDRKNNTQEYQEIVQILSGYLQFNDEGQERIYVPNLTFVVDGKIIANDYETSLDTHGLKDPSEYWTEEAVKNLEDRLTPFFQTIKNSSNICSDCNK